MRYRVKALNERNTHSFLNDKNPGNPEIPGRFHVCVGETHVQKKGERKGRNYGLPEYYNRFVRPRKDPQAIRDPI